MPVSLNTEYNNNINSRNVTGNPMPLINSAGSADPFDIKDPAPISLETAGSDIKKFEQAVYADAKAAMAKFSQADSTTALEGNDGMNGAGSVTAGVPLANTGIPSRAGRPPDDSRSAEQIINDSPVARNLGDQKDIKRDSLKKQVGDWENDPDPKKRADAAYNLVQVLEYIDSSATADGASRGNGDGDINGITSSGDARHGTEAGVLKDFAEQGYSVFDGSHSLPTTNDSHVRADGSNKDNAQWFIGELGKAFSFIPGVNTVLQPMGEATGGFGSMLEAGVKGAADTVSSGVKGVADTVSSGVKGAADTVSSGVKGAADTVSSGMQGAATSVEDKLFGGSLPSLTS